MPKPMGELLASALCFGVPDFVSGLLSRRVAGTTVSLYGQLGGTALSLAPAAFWPATGAAAWGWAALFGSCAALAGVGPTGLHPGRIVAR
jgi:hypothetical protein